MKKIVSVVAVLAVVSFGGVAAANLLKAITFGGATSVLIDGGASSDSQVMMQANRGLVCLTILPGVGGSYDTVNIMQQVSNDGVNWLTVADAGPVNVTDAGAVADFLTMTPQPFALNRIAANGQLQAGSISCTSNNTDQP